MPAGMHCQKNFCRETLPVKGGFDRRSFRMKKISKGKRILVACPVGKWNAKAQRCKVGMKLHAILRPIGDPKCRTCAVPSRKQKATRKTASRKARR